MFLRWVRTTAGFSFSGAASLEARNFFKKPAYFAEIPREYLLRTRAGAILTKSSVDISNNFSRPTPRYEWVLKVLLFGAGVDILLFLFYTVLSVNSTRCPLNTASSCKLATKVLCYKLEKLSNLPSRLQFAKL